MGSQRVKTTPIEKLKTNIRYLKVEVREIKKQVTPLMLAYSIYQEVFKLDFGIAGVGNETQ